ncbi:MAG TPA: PAS domain S-box protein, partial [Coleofasciculaceae cyanobacterium]
MNINYQSERNQQLLEECCNCTRHQSKNRYRDIVEAQLELICRFLPDGTLTFVNQSFRCCFNQQPEELIGENFLRLIPESEREVVKQIWRSLNLDYPTATYTHHIILFQGKTAQIYWTNRAIFDEQGHIVEIQAVGRGIDAGCSRETQTIQTPNSALHLFQAIFSGALDAMLIADDQGNYIDANPAACQLFGRPRAELLGCNVSNFTELGGEFSQVWRNFLEQGRVTGEFRLLRSDGTVRETEFAATANILPHQHLSVLRDVTQRKHVEAQLLTLNAQLEQTVIEQTEELIRANQELKQEIWERQRAEEALQLQAERERLIVAIAQNIRQSLDLDEILNTTVTEVQQFLDCDRVLIYRTWSDGTGSVITEGLAPGCAPILGQPLPEEIFPPQCHHWYRQGRIRTVTDVEQDEMSPCLADMLRQIGVKSKIVVPIVQRDALWGLLIAHQCSAARQWQQWEVNLLSSLATQVAIAIQQAELYFHLAVELTERKQTEAALRESEERFRSTFEQAAVGICHSSLNGRF